MGVYLKINIYLKLFKAIYSNLTERGFRVYYNSKTPINDGGISLGQMVVANAIIEEEER